MRIVLILLSLWAWNAIAESRFALVVGNASYQYVTELVTPHQDAQDVKAALETLGFESTLHFDIANKSDFKNKLEAFLKTVKNQAGGKVVMYYSGHGLGHENVSFLVPIKADIQDAADIPEFAIDVEWVANKITEANKGGANVIILDACRDNPFKGIAGKSYAQGLASISPKGSLVIYATEPGKKAFESKKARNSIFTQHLLVALNDPQKNRQSVFDMISSIGDQMDQSVKQLPWHAGSLRGKFCFGGCEEQIFVPPKPIQPEQVIQPEPVKTYILEVRADISGVEVIVDNQSLGKTPLDVELKEGSHEIIVRNNGRQVKQTIDIKANREFKVEFGQTVAPVAATDKKTFTNSIGMEFVLIPAGSFQMGDNNSQYNDEKPVHQVEIKEAFYLGKTEVTQKQYQAIMGDNPSEFKGENRPVERVSWNDAQEFIKKLNAKEGANKYRLPTEAEWEYAARANTSTKWSFGYNESELKNYAWYRENSGSETHDVGQKKPNGFGLFDMHGNVWEWTCSDYGEYRKNNHLECSSKNNANKSLRGGSWYGDADNCRSAHRDNSTPGGRGSSFGFRVVSLAPPRRY